MRKAIVWGVVLLIATVLLPLGMTSAQRLREEPVRLGTETSEEGTLSLLIQEELSTAVGGNRPLRVSLEGAISLVPPENTRFVGFTSATFTASASPLVLNRGCFAESPDTHPCTRDELFNSQPPPPEWPGSVILGGDFGAACFDGAGQFVDCGAEAHPTACCSGPAD